MTPAVDDGAHVVVQDQIAHFPTFFVLLMQLAVTVLFISAIGVLIICLGVGVHRMLDAEERRG